MAGALHDEGFEVQLREPDRQDPLSGVIDLSGSFGLIQIINFGESFPALIDDALREADLVVREGSDLKLVPRPHLIALKVYAGGFGSKADIASLIERNPDLDLDPVRALCRRYRLDRRLEAILREIDRSD